MAGKKPGVETNREDGAWKNRVQGNQRASNTHGTRARRRPRAERWPESEARSTSSRRWTAPSVSGTPTATILTLRRADPREGAPGTRRDAGLLHAGGSRGDIGCGCHWGVALSLHAEDAIHARASAHRRAQSTEGPACRRVSCEKPTTRCRALCFAGSRRVARCSPADAADESSSSPSNVPSSGVTSTPGRRKCAER